MTSPTRPTDATRQTEPVEGTPVKRNGPTWGDAATAELLDAIVALPDRGAAEQFFRDLCTLRELHDMAQRWHVAQLLDEGRHYLDISRQTGASTATITRIAQWLHHGTGGYAEALARRGEAQPAGARPAQTQLSEGEP